MRALRCVYLGRSRASCALRCRRRNRPAE